MPEKYKNRYRIKSSRHPTWDYGSNAAYFVTICTHGREHFFGKITDYKMQLSSIGEIANECWSQIPEHFTFVKLGAFIVMPNHVHGIIIIDKPAVPPVQTQNIASLPGNKFGPQSQNLASIVRGFKIGVTKNAREYGANVETQNFASLPFKWQPRFHDHIIRNRRSFDTISQYIVNNPLHWSEDKLYSR